MDTIVISGPPVIEIANPGPAGARGPQGTQGDPGAQGQRGPAGLGGAPDSVQVYVKAELITLPNTGGWQVVRTSAGTGNIPLQASIPAEVGDRLWIDITAMRNGGGTYMDCATLTAADGTPHQYGGSGTTTPLDEGAPEYYPDIGPLPSSTGTLEIIVQAAEIDADGKVTVAQVCRGAGGGTETLYASAVYPWRILVRNAGPRPTA